MSKQAFARASRMFKLVFIVAAAATLSGCANFYVDTGLADMQPAQVSKVPAPKPAQLLFEFQTKGVVNTRATEMLKAQVLELAQASGMFSQVSTDPVPNGALLNIIVDNVPLTDDAAAKGFLTGLTFGAVGNVVTDGYVCTVNYVAQPGAARVSKSLKHAIHTTVGAKGSPQGAPAAESIDAAVRTMMRQIVLHSLDALAKDPALQKQ